MEERLARLLPEDGGSLPLLGMVLVPNSVVVVLPVEFAETVGAVELSTFPLALPWDDATAAVSSTISSSSTSRISASFSDITNSPGGMP
jgi:hypothetical protein